MPEVSFLTAELDLSAALLPPGKLKVMIPDLTPGFFLSTEDSRDPLGLRCYADEVLPFWALLTALSAFFAFALL